MYGKLLGAPRRVTATMLALLAPLLPTTPAAGQDPRSVELLRYGCTSELGRYEITLFANGTVRLREGPWDDQALALDELGPEALEDNLRVLRGAYSEREIDPIRQPLLEGLDGNWIERCEIYLALPEMSAPLHYEFASYDTPNLRISRLIHIADELADHVRPVDDAERLPADYEPRFGDVLRNGAGARFQVLRMTTDRRGVELQGIDEPVRIFVAIEQLADTFVAIEQRSERRWWWRP